MNASGPERQVRFFVFTVLFASIAFVPRLDAEQNQPSYVRQNFLTCSVQQTRVEVAPKASPGFVRCDYQVESAFSATQLLLRIGEVSVPLSRESVARYPATGQKTALQLLFDISDPARQRTVSEIYPLILAGLEASKKAHVDIGVSTFSDRLTEIRPIGSSSAAVSSGEQTFQATGAATEMNRMMLEAIGLLAKHAADRKAIVVISDGKAEDTEYSLEDVVKRANEVGLPIIALGIAERPSDTPALQSLRKLADLTGGRFIDLSGKTVPTDLAERLLEVTDGGGRISFDGSPFYGPRLISVILNDKDKRGLTLKATIDFPDNRTLGDKVKQTAKSFWWAILGGLALLVGGVVFFMRRRAMHAAKEAPPPILAELRELSGSEIVHHLRKSGVTIGRDATNDVVLRNSSVSSRHAELHRSRAGAFMLSDLGSTNGVFVNGEKVNATELRSGDIIEIAEVRLQFNLQS
jgi:hypothetical protein